jgi:hypothetical protein
MTGNGKAAPAKIPSTSTCEMMREAIREGHQVQSEAIRE